MPSWASDAIVYHLYPLGLCGAPARNDFHSPPVSRLARLRGWTPHLRALGMNAVYLGPVFESGTHGYDTADYTRVDRRLGTNADLRQWRDELHAAGIRLVVDTVFHHVGRDFWAFQDLRARGEQSRYRDWFAGGDFRQRGPLGDAFAYETWRGHASLVKWNLRNPEVRAYLFGVVEGWISAFGIDGLRLDVAEDMDLDFLRELAAWRHRVKPDLWLLGEAIHGDYRRLVNPQTLDSATNYECYKGLYSSHNDRNYFELAHSLHRQFGEGGLYKDLSLYAFVDNHDVDRIASTLREPAHLVPLHVLLFGMPGVPSLYYGSEWGLTGQKRGGDDAPLRPALEAPGESPLTSLVARLARIRHATPALRRGNYRQLFVASEQFAFAREYEGQRVLVAVNAAPTPATLSLEAGRPEGSVFVDALDPRASFRVRDGRLLLEGLAPRAGRILVPA